MSDSCDGCGRAVEDALARAVRLQVDDSTVDDQRLCPTCFADWITRYKEKMSPKASKESSDSEIIVD
ncbi:hypothetical protein E6P09_02800 [Haloferax mediterranei ATCC 33500]|uniref:Small CPxCG-related zinc finger protein n=1 Tax=Haloferax mediterranei (strain ATCC 33500 / DSM 1411 / JCM 8866 / NBRC 14739 / NCIMB 2177 / R-4) TaxID=523841 RepID=I3R8S7_HALMT|nr:MULTISPECIES: hypothetical protein [Haloferacaceae]AFK20637.1 hypothetical protein HFX_2973 [Haloferax mediterranei ATCC 33500]AHZ22878.1 hypothetical protein BM92_09605 [Haloferax mediterranei ATCC 33500]EMA03043.1 hypothetical protein C439_10680 [Haloferax mediterranei ATCC 33500]MDX5987776.1 hypothetical protein [Haloferax mediterranei ATCC 33500]QCQ74255.1 hypothetical protein E6P09_02800 [Haloferax mediterranei ATCC 33500]